MTLAAYETDYNDVGTVIWCAKHAKSLRRALSFTKIQDLHPQDGDYDCECCEDPALEAVYLEEHMRKVAAEEAQIDDPEWAAFQYGWEYATRTRQMLADWTHGDSTLYA